MKTPQQLADEKAMEIAKNLGSAHSSVNYHAKIISAHLLPLYECVEALRKHHAHHSEKCEVFFPKDNFTYLDVDNETTLIPTDLGEAYQESDLAEQTVKALSNLSTSTTEKKEGQ